MKYVKRYGKEKRWNRKMLVRKNGAICALCGMGISTMKEITLDHILSRSKGGLDELNNLQLAHYECNQAKDDMTMEEWLEFQEL